MSEPGRGIARPGLRRSGPQPPPRPVADTSWRDGAPAVLEEHRGSLADSESDASYHWAAGAVAKRDVLDVCCGAGHGSAVLLESGAKSVVGIEPSPEAVALAAHLYGDRVRFIVGEPQALPTPFAAETFDAVTCFGPLEREADPELRLEALKLLLAPGGVLLVSLPLQPPREPITGEPLGRRRSAEQWRELLEALFGNVRLHRRRSALATTVLAADESTEPAGAVSWLGANEREDSAMVAIASDDELPELDGGTTLIGSRDLRAYRETIYAWEQRARRAEADGSAKHWELVASREAQRRLRKRLWHLEHTPIRKLFRIVRGKPARLSEGPPIRPPELEAESWE